MTCTVCDLAPEEQDEYFRWFELASARARSTSAIPRWDHVHVHALELPTEG